MHVRNPALSLVGRRIELKSSALELISNYKGVNYKSYSSNVFSSDVCQKDNLIS